MPEIMITGWPAIVLAFISALLVTWYYVPKVVSIVRRRHLEDKPNGHKIHHSNVPTLGGIGIFAGFLIGYLLGVDGYLPGLSYFTAAVVILFFIGMKDDLIAMNQVKKLAGESVAAVIIFFCTDLSFTSLHGFLGIEHISPWASFFITVFVIILIINAVNLIDGIDGLAATVGVVTSVTFGIFFYLSGDYGYTVIAAALTGALIAFLRFNLSKGRFKIFMGDTGSLVIGFTLAVFAIRFNELVAQGRSVISLTSAPAVAIGILIVPLFDTLRVIVLRIAHNQSPFKADQRHIHHLMLRAGFTHRESTLYIALFNIMMIAIAFLLDGVGMIWLGVILFTICLGAAFFVHRAAARKAPVVKVPHGTAAVEA